MQSVKGLVNLFAMSDEIFNENAQTPLKMTTKAGYALIFGFRSRPFKIRIRSQTLSIYGTGSGTLVETVKLGWMNLGKG